MSEIYTEIRGGGRLSFGGDEFIFVELSEEMRIPQALAIQSLATSLKGLQVEGVLDVCPSHASYMIRFEPGKIDLPAFLRILEDAHEQTLAAENATIQTTIVDIPVYYSDPWTKETLLKFRDRHQDPHSTDSEYVARVNGYESPEELSRAHSENPFLVTFPNFVPGNAESVQLVPRELQIEAPKYKRPRTETPSRAIGHGGAFTNIYPSFGAGGVQLLGRTPINIIDMSQTHPDFKESPVLLTAGTLISFRPIDAEEYFAIRSAAESGSFRVQRAQVEFSVDRHLADWRGYNIELKEALR